MIRRGIPTSRQRVIRHAIGRIADLIAVGRGALAVPRKSFAGPCPNNPLNMYAFVSLESDCSDTHLASGNIGLSAPQLHRPTHQKLATPASLPPRDRNKAMSLRIPCTLLVLALFAGVACTDHSSGLSSATQPDNGNNPGSTPGNSGGNPGAPVEPGDPGDPIVGKPSPGEPQPGEPIPEPGTMLLLGTGLAGAAVYHRRRQRRKIARSSS